jgi:hypothetical protein
VQRLGIDRDVQAHLGPLRGTGGAQRFGVVEQAVELVGSDLVVVLDPCIMLAYRSRW